MDVSTVLGVLGGALGLVALLASALLGLRGQVLQDQLKAVREDVTDRDKRIDFLDAETARKDLELAAALKRADVLEKVVTSKDTLETIAATLAEMNRSVLKQHDALMRLVGEGNARPS